MGKSKAIEKMKKEFQKPKEYLFDKVPKPMKELVQEMIALKDKAGRLGLYRTTHSLDSATKAVGWELAELVKPKREKQKIPLKRRK